MTPSRRPRAARTDQRQFKLRRIFLATLCCAVNGATSHDAPFPTTPVLAFLPHNSGCPLASAFVLPGRLPTASRTNNGSHLLGWLDNFLPKPIDEESSLRAEEERRSRYPEQYPATYELLDDVSSLSGDCIPDGSYVRPLLKQTQLEKRPLRVAYVASVDGWDASEFHRKVDGRGAAVVLAFAENGQVFGGYNPKGWASTGGARPSVAAFLFYERDVGDSGERTQTFQKLRKVGGGGLACSGDEPGYGVSFGPDGLVAALQPGRERLATSKLGTYYERGPEELDSLLQQSGGAVQLKELKVLVGVYTEEEEIPYSGAVLDMTSG